MNRMESFVFDTMCVRVYINVYVVFMKIKTDAMKYIIMILWICHVHILWAGFHLQSILKKKLLSPPPTSPTSSSSLGRFPPTRFPQRGKMSRGSELIPGNAAVPLTPMLTGPKEVGSCRKSPMGWIPCCYGRFMCWVTIWVFPKIVFFPRKWMVYNGKPY